MIGLDGQPILTAAEMRAAEDQAIAAGATVESLMERAGAGVAEAVRRIAAGCPVLILCGPGNNGGDGYVAARVLRENGVDVRVASAIAPKTEAAVHARQGWNGPTERIDTAVATAVVVDAVFGTGLGRALDDGLAQHLARLGKDASLSIAVDLPSGVDTDTGAAAGQPRPADLTLALGAVKPAHVLQPSARFCGAVRLLDIGIDATSRIHVMQRPSLLPLSPDAHKYTRGMVAIIAGTMPGAAALSAEATLRSGAGYALLLGDERPAGLPHAIVQRPWTDDALDDKRVSAVLIGPGLGRDKIAARRLDAALASERTLVIDGDALHLLADGRLDALRRRGNAIMTPHAGEFEALFGKPEGGKIVATQAAARRSGAVVVFKGADTVIAAPDGQAQVAIHANPWLSTAGTGDVLAGAIAASAKLGPLFRAGVIGVWLHAEAARRLGGAFIADDLARELTAVRASL